MVCDAELWPTGTLSCDAEPFPDTQESQLVPAAIAPGLLKGKRCFSPGTALGCVTCTPVSGEPGVLVVSPAGTTAQVGWRRQQLGPGLHQYPQL